MIVPLLALVQMFAATDSMQSLCDMQLVRERAFDLRVEHLSLSFHPQPCRRFHSTSFRAFHWPYGGEDPTGVYVKFDDPQFLSSATAEDAGCRLDLYSPSYWPLRISP